jgi:hypothetical protein
LRWRNFIRVPLLKVEVKTACPNFRGSRIGLWSLGFGCGVEPFMPRIRRSPCDTDAPQQRAAARAPWNKWEGPAQGRSAAKAPAGRRPFMPRKALAAARAALRFAHQAANECGLLNRRGMPMWAFRTKRIGRIRHHKPHSVETKPQGAVPAFVKPSERNNHPFGWLHAPGSVDVQAINWLMRPGTRQLHSHNHQRAASRRHDQSFTPMQVPTDRCPHDNPPR